MPSIVDSGTSVCCSPRSPPSQPTHRRPRVNSLAAVQSRQIIGEAIGILRANTNLSSADAFQLLSQASQRMNVKLRDVAAQVARNEGALVDDDGGKMPDVEG